MTAYRNDRRTEDAAPLNRLQVSKRDIVAPIYPNTISAFKAVGTWDGSFNGKESSLHQLSPYLGKIKSGIARVLVENYSRPGDWVLDPFCGAGVVPLEALLLGRKAAGSDLSPYAYCLTMGKVTAPSTKEEALERAQRLIDYVHAGKHMVDVRLIDKWVRRFFHPKTLREAVTAFTYCRRHGEWFLGACLCGILHHQRPGFLSHPASHLVPYLRDRLFPRERFPSLYSYRPLEGRLIKKIERSYRRTNIDEQWNNRTFDIRNEDARVLSFRRESMDLVVTSPPYLNTLTYGRDNRLRLWFLGQPNWQSLDKRLITRDLTYRQDMGRCVRQIYEILKLRRYCAFILGDVRRNGRINSTADLVVNLVLEVTKGRMVLVEQLRDEIPDVRRARRHTKTTKEETLLVFRKAW